MDKIKKFFKKYRVTILFYIALIVFYHYVTINEIANSFLFPTVEEIINAFKDFGGILFINMFSSFGLLIPAMACSIGIAMSVGILLGMNRKLREEVNPIIYSISVVPSILLSPFALLLAPSFKAASIFLIVYATLWPTLFGTITGIMTIDKRYLDKAKTLEICGLEKMIKVVLPAASPSIFAGFVSSLRSSFMILVYSEMYGAKYGMGFFVKINAELGMYDKTWAGFIFMVIVLVTVMQIFEKLKVRALRWTI